MNDSTSNSEPLKNLAVSVHRRLLNSARRNNEDFNQVLTNYAIERLLYRLGESSYRERFVLKGASLYAVWHRENAQLANRPTRDLDFWSSGQPEVEGLIDTFREILSMPVEADGLDFRSDEVRGVAMREGQRYIGCRINTTARLGQARISTQIDLGFGDAITPAAYEIDYPTRLSFPAPRLKAYPRETVVAEKFEAMVSLGMTNTRMKDFFDLWTLANHFEFEGEVLQSALTATFERRGTELPNQTPLALTPRFTQDTAKVMAWRAFVKRNLLGEVKPLEIVASTIEAFLIPLIVATRQGQKFYSSWRPTSGWTTNHVGNLRN